LRHLEELSFSPLAFAAFVANSMNRNPMESSGL
jgi:hypothetical protein